jgi:hypothetical protein
MFDQCNKDGAYVRWSSILLLSKNLGGVVSLCGGSYCSLYSTRERGGGGVCLVF